MFAQTAPPVLDIVAWINVVVQLGSFGLLTVIILKLWPQQQESLKAERERRDDKFADIVKQLQAEFEKRNEKLIQVVENQTKVMTDLNTSLASQYRDGVTKFEQLFAHVQRNQDLIRETLELEKRKQGTVR